MDTNAVSATTAAASASAGATATSKSTLGKDDFLKLLTAQLANQDPLQPVDNQAFIAQLAQFSSLEQMQNVASKLDGLLTATALSTQVNAAGLVGKAVTYDAGGVDLSGTGGASMQVKLPVAATVTAVIQDAAGRTVRTLAVGAHPAGTFDLAWDGRDAAGTPLPPGHYGVTLSATTPAGAKVAVQGLAKGTVQGVQVGDGGTSLVVGGAAVNLSDVVEFSEP